MTDPFVPLSVEDIGEVCVECASLLAEGEHLHVSYRIRNAKKGKHCSPGKPTSVKDAVVVRATETSVVMRLQGRYCGQEDDPDDLFDVTLPQKGFEYSDVNIECASPVKAAKSEKEEKPPAKKAPPAKTATKTAVAKPAQATKAPKVTVKEEMDAFEDLDDLLDFEEDSNGNPILPEALDGGVVEIDSITATIALDPKQWTLVLRTPYDVQRLHDWWVKYFEVIDVQRRAPFHRDPKKGTDGKADGKDGKFASKPQGQSQGMPKVIRFVKDDMLLSLKAFASAGLGTPSILQDAHVLRGVRNILKRLIYFRKLAAGVSQRLALEWISQVEEEENPSWVMSADKRAAQVLRATSTGAVKGGF